MRGEPIRRQHLSLHPSTDHYFHSFTGFEVGRLPGEVAVWVSKLIDLDIAEFEANVVACPPVLSVGCDILLDVKAYLKRTAFPAAQDVRRSRNTRNEPTKNFFEETAETANEKELRQRKSSLIRMFKACDLRPTQANDILRQHTEEGHFGGSSMLDHFGGKEALRSSHSPPPPRKPNANANGTSTQTAIAIDSAGPSSPKTDEAPNDGGDEGQDVNDGTEMEADQMSAVYSKAQKHDVDLPEEEPPDTFALTLRPYQKQALGWMKNMEKPASLRQGREGQRTEASLHPLWQEYAFPADPNDNQEADDLGSFYFNPYIGEMSLEFQPASQGTRGGILADEMVSSADFAGVWGTTTSLTLSFPLPRVLVKRSWWQACCTQTARPRTRKGKTKTKRTSVQGKQTRKVRGRHHWLLPSTRALVTSVSLPLAKLLSSLHP